jgi:hypothetical protein
LGTNSSACERRQGFTRQHRHVILQHRRLVRRQPDDHVTFLDRVERLEVVEQLEQVRSARPAIDPRPSRIAARVALVAVHQLGAEIGDGADVLAIERDRLAVCSTASSVVVVR